MQKFSVARQATCYKDLYLPDAVLTCQVQTLYTYVKIYINKMWNVY